MGGEPDVDAAMPDQFARRLWLGVPGPIAGRRHRRTATIYPAAIRTELLATISDPASLGQMQTTYDTYQIAPERIADVVAFAIGQPEDTTINEFTVGPANQPW